MIIELKHLTQIRGAGRGRKMLVPTINFPVPNELQNIPFGIYAGITNSGEKNYSSAIHYGPIPTFDDDEPRLEVYLIDERGAVFSPETWFDVTFLAKIRDVQTFDSPESLKTQILQDIEQIREILRKK